MKWLEEGAVLCVFVCTVLFFLLHRRTIQARLCRASVADCAAECCERSPVGFVERKEKRDQVRQTGSGLIRGGR